MEDKAGSSDNDKSDFNKMFPKNADFRDEVGDIGNTISKSINTINRQTLSEL